MVAARWLVLSGAALLVCQTACKKPPIDLALTPGCNPFSTTRDCLLPFPSSFFQTDDVTSATGVRVNYPPGIFGASNSGVTVDVTLSNTADGAPPISPILVYFAAFRKHIGFYPPVKGDDRLLKAVAPYAGPKGNLRFPLDRPMPLALIERIVKLSVKRDRAARAT